MIAVACSSLLHIETNKQTFRKLTLFWLEVFPYTHGRELIKRSDVLFQFHFLLFTAVVLHMGIFHFVASCAEGKLSVASLSNLMRATQKPWPLFKATSDAPGSMRRK